MHELGDQLHRSRRRMFAARTAQLCRIVAGQASRVVVCLAGMTILALGIVLLPLPGPGTLVVALGLGVLSVEFAWARRGLAHLQAAVAKLRQELGNRLFKRFRPRPPVV